MYVCVFVCVLLLLFCVYPILVSFKIINTYIHIHYNYNYIISIVQNIKFNITLVDILLLVGWLHALSSVHPSPSFAPSA